MNIRLREYEIEALKRNFAAVFPVGDRLWIFGSRVELDKRGGDIDLYVETSLNGQMAYDAKLKFVNLVCDDIGDQRIDVVLNLTNSEENLPIYQIAREQGVQLI